MDGCFKHSTDEPITGSSVPAPGAFTLDLPGDPVTGFALIDTAEASIIANNGWVMSWTPSANAANYLLEIARDDTFDPAYSVYSPTLASTYNSTVVSSTNLNPAYTLYYWRVQAINASGSPYASNRPFIFYTGLGAFAPGAFDLSSPLDSAAGPVSSASPDTESLTPTVQWTTAATETLYTVYVATDTSFTSPYTTTTKAGVLTVDIPASANLTDTARYYWAVTATGYISQTASTTPYYSFVTGPIKYYTYTTIAPTTIIAGQGISATLSAYDNNAVAVTSHTPFSITMSATPGVTFYTDNTLVTPTTTYNLASGAADIYLAITTSGSAVITATDIASRSVSSSVTTITVNPAALDHYSVVPDSYSIVSGTAISVTITAQDVYSNTVTSASTDITMIINTTSGTPTATFYQTGSWNAPPVIYTNPWASGVVQISMKAEVSGATDEKFTIRAEDAATKYGTSGEVTVSP